MTLLLWFSFSILVTALVVVDLRVTGRKGRALTLGEGLVWTSFYVFVAMAFNVLIYLAYEHDWIETLVATDVSGRRAALQFFTAWLLEKSLSLDNVFVMALVFSYFQVPRELQHRVLMWGVLGAVVMRAGLIGLGSFLLIHLMWTAYVFGALLVATAVRMLVSRHDNLLPEDNGLVRLARRKLPITGGFRGERFLVRESGRLHMTPLFLALLMVESADLVFAIDSVPAALAVTTDPFIIITANTFAVLGLRALYFVLAAALDRLRYLKISLAFVICFAGIKLLLSHTHPIPNVVSLTVILGILGVGIVGSFIAGERDPASLVSPLVHDLEELAEVTRHHAWRIIMFVMGSTIAVVGLVVVFAPGPGLLILFGGLSILALEFERARWWRSRDVVEPVDDTVDAVRDRFRADPR